jgi:hypothetical protein
MLNTNELERFCRGQIGAQYRGNKHRRLQVDTVQTEGVVTPKSFTRPPLLGETLAGSGTNFLQAGYEQAH